MMLMLRVCAIAFLPASSCSPSAAHRLHAHRRQGGPVTVMLTGRRRSNRIAAAGPRRISSAGRRRARGPQWALHHPRPRQRARAHRIRGRPPERAGGQHRRQRPAAARAERALRCDDGCEPRRRPRAGVPRARRQRRARPRPCQAVPRGPVIAAKTPDDARRAVREVAALKPDWIKIRVDDNLGTGTKMPPEVYRAVIEERMRTSSRSRRTSSTSRTRRGCCVRAWIFSRTAFGTGASMRADRPDAGAQRLPLPHPHA
jgi:hypothetical protein